ncbi:MAG: molybdate ABC transporter substrate-binding protein [Beutenbergiaceae bacterium]
MHRSAVHWFRAPGVAGIAVLSLVLAASACSNTPEPAPTVSASESTEGTAAADQDLLSGTLTVYAAASLTDSFDEIAAAFEDAHPGVDVAPVIYDGSSTLATQIIEGAPADVFASANEANMDKVVQAGLAQEPTLFATNTLVIAVPLGNPGEVTGLADLANPDLTVVLCAPEVPCGAASATLLQQQNLEVEPDSMEQNVRAVLTKVSNDIADAGLVYATDAAVEPEVETVEAAGADQVINRYPLVALTEAANPEAAAAFVEFVTGPQGQSVLAGYGFGSG